MTRLLNPSRLGALLLLLVPLMPSPATAAEEFHKEPLPVKVFKNLQAGKKQTVVVYGTSLTIKGEWTKALNAYFDQQFPGLVTFHNSAKSGMHSDWGVANLQERVLAQNPDLVFIEFSMNDAATKNNVSLEKSQANLDSMIKALRQQNPDTDIVLQTMDVAWDSPRMLDKKYGSDRPNLEAYYEVYRRYAKDHQLPLVDNYLNWLKIQKEEPDRYQKMVSDGIHPSSTSSVAVTWPAVEALLEKARGIAATDGAMPHVRIARFSGNRAAAISYTFDDNTRDQYTVGVPMLNEAGFKGTFFVIPDATSETVEDAAKKVPLKRAWGSITWTELKEISEQGHEIASHTWSHPNMTKLTSEEVDAQFGKAYNAIKTRIGKPPLTLAFPFNASTPEVQAAALKYHVAFRAYQIGLGEKSTVASLNAWADKQIGDKTWGVIMAHAIANGYSALGDPEILRAHLRYVKSREGEIWVDTFANIARYEKERDQTKLEISGKPGNLTCLLSSTLDPEVYNVPLTFIIDAAGATSPHAERAGQELPIGTSSNSIHFDAIPNSQPIRVTWK